MPYPAGNRSPREWEGSVVSDTWEPAQRLQTAHQASTGAKGRPSSPIRTSPKSPGACIKASMLPAGLVAGGQFSWPSMGISYWPLTHAEAASGRGVACSTRPSNLERADGITQEPAISASVTTISAGVATTHTSVGPIQIEQGQAPSNRVCGEAAWILLVPPAERTAALGEVDLDVEPVAFVRRWFTRSR